MQTNIQHIENRLRQKAIEIWQIDEEQIKNFDPLVNLLIGACASEFSRLYNQLENADTHVLERLAQITLPEVILSPKSGHTILYAQPNRPDITLKRNESRIYAQDYFFKSKDLKKDVYFSPVVDTKLSNVAIQKIALDNTLYEVENPKSKTSLAKTSNQAIPHGNVWLGLKIEESITTPVEIPFYFQTETEDKNFYTLLQLSQWTTDEGTILTNSSGFNSKSNSLKNLSNGLGQHETEVLCFYKFNYVKLKVESYNSSLYPEAFKEHFAKDDLDNLQDNLTWVKITFPTAVSADTLKNLIIAINAIPVLNRHKESIKVNNVKQGINITTLEKEDLFLAIEEVTNDKSFKYTSVETSILRQQKQGTYAMRRGRMSKMDKRSASELLSYMTDLIRDERMAFKALDRTQLSKGLKLIEDWLDIYQEKANNQDEVPTYLITNPHKGDDRIYIDFWNTLGQQANEVKSNATLSVLTGDDIQIESMLLLKDVQGGKNRPNMHERLHIFKSTFLSRGRIVTAEDIKAFCFKEMGDLLNQVSVSVGYKSGNTPKVGIIKVIRVTLLPHSSIVQDQSIDFVFWAKRLERLLESRSAGYQPFEVIFKNTKNLSHATI